MKEELFKSIAWVIIGVIIVVFGELITHHIGLFLCGLGAFMVGYFMVDVIKAIAKIRNEKNSDKYHK